MQTTLFLSKVLFCSILLFGMTFAIMDTPTCVSCANSFNKKLCISDLSFQNAACCDLNDSSFMWGGGTKGMCSTDIDYPGDSEYTLCDVDINAWGQQMISAYRYNDNYVTSNYIPVGGMCWYRVSNAGYNYKGVEFDKFYLKNVRASIYRQRRGRYFELLTGLTSNNGTYYADLDYNTNDLLYVVVVSTNNQVGGFEMRATSSRSKELSGGAIAGIVLGSIAFWCIFVGICWCCCKRRKRLMNQRQMRAQMNVGQVHQPLNQNPINYSGQVQHPQNQIVNERQPLIPNPGPYQNQPYPVALPPNIPQAPQYNKLGPAYPTIDQLD